MTSVPSGTTQGEQALDITDASEGGSAVAGLTPRQLAFRRFKKDPVAMLTLVLCAIFLLMAVLSPVLAAVGVIDPIQQHQNLTNHENGGLPLAPHGGIAWGHLLGIVPSTGQDTLSRCLVGTSNSLLIAICASIITVVIGVVLGIVAGTAGGLTDSVIGRLIDLTLSFPQTLMLLALFPGLMILLTETAHIHPDNLAAGIYVIFVLSLFGWPPLARLLRGLVLSLREREFVDAARVLGASRSRIYFKEMLPNLWAAILVQVTLLLPLYVSAEAALSFLGVGIQAPTPTLGNVLSDSFQYDIADPVYFFVPAIFIAVIVVSFNVFGDALRDAMDPRADR